MIKICFFPNNKTAAEILTELDLEKFDRMARWLSDLPPTKRGNLPYRICTGGYGKLPGVVFTRRIDALAFRLAFGL